MLKVKFVYSEIKLSLAIPLTAKASDTAAASPLLLDRAVPVNVTLFIVRLVLTPNLLA